MDRWGSREQGLISIQQPPLVWYSPFGSPGQLAEPGIQALMEGQEVGGRSHLESRMFQRVGAMAKKAILLDPNSQFFDRWDPKQALLVGMSRTAINLELSPSLLMITGSLCKIINQWKAGISACIVLPGACCKHVSMQYFIFPGNQAIAIQALLAHRLQDKWLALILALNCLLKCRENMPRSTQYLIWTEFDNSGLNCPFVRTKVMTVVEYWRDDYYYYFLKKVTGLNKSQFPIRCSFACWQVPFVSLCRIYSGGLQGMILEIPLEQW